MRQIFSVRFFAAVGGVFGLFFLLTTIFATREVIDGRDGGPAPVEIHTIDFVDQIFSSRNETFGFTADGLAADDTELIIDESRSLNIVADTPGNMLCPQFPQVGACAVVADLLGEAVVWFALVPSGNARTVDLPAIDTLDDGLATLVNGWQVPFAPVLDRRCQDEFSSYREFREVLGDDFTSVFSIDDRELIAVECDTKVEYAPDITALDDTVLDNAAPDGTVLDAAIPVPPADDATGVDVGAAIDEVLAGEPLDDAVDRLAAAGWTVRADDLDDLEAFTDAVRPDRVTIAHRDGVVVAVVVG